MANTAPIQDAFEDAMDAHARELRGEWYDGKVAGITWANPDGTSRQDIARGLVIGAELTLQLEPENPFDKHAVALFTSAGQQLGYLEARMAAEVCRLLKRGGQARCFVRACRERNGVCGVSFGLVSVAAEKVRA